MSNPLLNRKRCLAGGGALAALLAGAAIVHACGPFFPLQLLDNRAGTLTGTPTNSFAYEAMHLVVPADRLLAPEAVPVPAGQTRPDPDKAALAGLTPAQVATLGAMAKAVDGDAAYALGQGVPDAQRLYAAAEVDLTLASDCAPASADAKTAAEAGTPGSGASAASASQPPVTSAAAASDASAASAAPAAKVRTCDARDALRARAASRLNAILALPASAAAPRAVAAASDLAAVAEAQTDDCGAGDDCTPSVAALHAAYAKIRALALAGAPDPKGLAVGSFGDEALLSLRSKTGDQCDYSSFINNRPCATGIPAADLAQAIGLYAQQAARGSNSGLQSLRVIAAWALTDPAHAAPLIDDPLAQRLLVAYALARVGDIVNDDPSSATEYYGAYDTSFGPIGYADAARGDAGIKTNPALLSLVEAIRQRGIDHVAGADRLAALAYRVGRYDFAAELVGRQHSALASWVKAKLALRRGDTAAAVQAYAEASKGFPQTDPSIDAASAELIKGEQGVLTLSRGQYVEALGYLYAAAVSYADAAGPRDEDSAGIGFDNDMAYVAERVLTTDELKTFVDAHAPATPAPALPASAANANAYTGGRAGLGDTLRYLLARRLVRDGRIDDALPYFPADGDPRFVTYSYDEKGVNRTALQLRKRARDYADALHDGEHAWFAVNRARGWFAAATIARTSGMELMGYEQTPDYADIGGAFDGGSGRSGVIGANRRRTPSTDDAGAGAPAAPATPATRADAALAGPFVTADEKRRYAASESRPPLRFHYRYIAADELSKAADALPPRSQAFAAVLCRATGSMQNNDAQRAAGFYRRYVKQGAYVDFGGPFGSQCAEPDFREAATFTYAQAWKRVKRDVVRHKALGALIALLVLGAAAAGGGWVYRKRRGRQET